MRGRFAPSPTGRMHLGNARTALLSWLQVRAAGGQFLLRIEDLDRGRCRKEHVDTLLKDLEYLGLGWDEPPLLQSDRQARYDEALAALASQGRVYPCFCTRAEVAAAASAPHGPQDDGPRYGGTCGLLSQAQVEERQARRPSSLRFRPRPGVTRFEDGVQGAQAQDVDAVVGDFVVRRNDGVASYQLAVVVDDADSGITDVLRGDDLLSSSARQLQLFEALALPPPRFAHVPLWLSTDGRRLAKRTGAFAVADLRAAGVPAERVIGVLAALSGLTPAGEPRSAQSLVSGFSLEKLSKEPVRVGEAELNALLGLPA